MRFLTYAAETPAADLALEEALHVGLEEGASPPTWRVWSARAPAVVLGTGQEAAKEADLAAARRAGVPVLRRHSGGGAVVIGPGVINYSLFSPIAALPGGENIRGAMAAGLAPVLAALRELGLAARLAGLSDVAVAAPDGMLRKLAGNAQARKRRSLVVHGTLLADPNWELLEALLHFPSRPPDYRTGRVHRAFLTSLRELGAPSDVVPFAAALRGALGGETADAAAPQPDELARARDLLARKYSADEWNLRR